MTKRRDEIGYQLDNAYHAGCHERDVKGLSREKWPPYREKILDKLLPGGEPDLEKEKAKREIDEGWVTHREADMARWIGRAKALLSCGLSELEARADERNQLLNDVEALWNPKDWDEEIKG